jgi:protein disulfide-isomerase
METITKVTASPPKIKPKLTISGLERVFFNVRVGCAEHPFWSVCVLAVVGFFALSWFRGRLLRSRNRGGSFRLEDAVGIRELKEGLLGEKGGGNGKVD